MKPIPLWLLALSSLVGYILIVFWFPLDPTSHHAPLPDIRTFTPTLWAGLAYGACLSVLFVLYGLACRQVRERAGVLSLSRILMVTACFTVPLILTFPINATDVYRYFVRGRLTVVHHVSPFAFPPSAFPSDPFFSLAGEWAGSTSPYGPIWELVAGGIALLSDGDLQIALCLFKGLGALLHLGVAVVIWLALSDAPPGRRAARTLLWAWNPALLLIFVVNGHNDALMLFWALLGALLVRHAARRRNVPGTAAGLVVMVLAPLTKPIGLLPLPLFYLAALRQVPDAKSRVRLLGLSGLGSLAVALLAFAPFAGSAQTPLALLPRLFQEAAGGAGYSPVALALLSARRLNLPLGLRDAVVLAWILFGLFFVSAMWRTWCGVSPGRTTADLSAAYLVQAANFRIWYAAWPFAWLVFEEDSGRERLVAGTVFLISAQFSVLIYGHLRVELFGGDHLWAHLLGVPLVFLLPLAAGWVERRRLAKV